MKRKTMPYSIQNGQRVFLLPAPKPENREDLNRQLGIGVDRGPWIIYIGAAVIVFLFWTLIIAGLTYPQWKHLLK